MSVALFLAGFVVTVAVFAAFALLIRAEIEDGRIAEAYEAGENHELDDDVRATRERKAAEQRRARELRPHAS